MRGSNFARERYNAHSIVGSLDRHLAALRATKLVSGLMNCLLAVLIAARFSGIW